VIEGGRAGEIASRRAGADPLGASAGEEGAQVAGLQSAEVGDRRRVAEVLGEEAQELRDVAVVGLDGLRRGSALGGERTAPAAEGVGEIGGGEDEDLGGGHGRRSR
jgi:hypothetical protein